MSEGAPVGSEADRIGRLWSRGEVVALRDVWFEVVWRAIAGIVVDDDGALAVFWIPQGSAASFPVDDAGEEIRLYRPEFQRGFRRAGSPVLVVCDTRAPWTLWHFFREVGTLDRWYVNFERYLGRSAVAYDSVDHKLDLIAWPDGSLQWKDEDELEEAGRLGLVDVAEIRRDAAQVVADPPWPTGWEDYRPDPSWPVPELPEGWAEV